MTAGLAYDFAVPIRALLLGFFCLFACHEPAKPAVTVSAASQPTTRPAANRPPPIDALPGGIDPIADLRERTNDKQTRRLIPGTALAAFQPKRLPGFSCDKPENTQGGVQGLVMTQSAMGCRQAIAGTKDGRSLILTIADYNAHVRMLSTYEALAKPGKEVKGKDVARAVTIGKFPGTFAMETASKIGRGAVVLQRRFLVSAQLTDGNEKDVIAILAAADLSGLAALDTKTAKTIELDATGNPIDSASKPVEKKK